MVVWQPALRGYALSRPQMRSTDPAKREAAFYSLFSLDELASGPASQAVQRIERDNPLNGVINRDLIQLLEVENKNAITRGGLQADEEFSDYYLDVLSVVSALNDRNAVDALTGGIGTGNVVAMALANIGGPAIPTLVRVAHDGKSEEKLGAITALIGMGDQSTSLSQSDKNRVIQTLQSSMDDPEPQVRIAAISGLAQLNVGSAAVIQRLRTIAETDEYLQTWDSSRKTYTVRDTANAALKRLGADGRAQTAR